MYVPGVDGTQRLSGLVEALRRDGRVDVAAAAAEFGTVELTIRRDLDVLVSRGVARRVRGGAVNLLMRGQELPFAMRELEGLERKRRIAARVAQLITDGEAVGLDAGTTVVEVARALFGRRLTVVPLSLHGAMILAPADSVRLVVPGGEVRPGELALVGPTTVDALRDLRLDTVVLGTCGVSAAGQVTTHDLGDAAVKRALLASGRRSVLAVDSAKFGHDAMVVVRDLAQFDVVVTDEGIPDHEVTRLESAGVEVLRV